MTAPTYPQVACPDIELTLQQQANIADEDLETIYRYATQFFVTGQHDKAANWLYLLVNMDPYNFDYWLMLGQSLQAINHHHEALYCLSQSGSIRLPDPRSAYFAAQSFLAVGNIQRACMAFESAAKLCGRNPQYAEMRQKAMAALEKYAERAER